MKFKINRARPNQKARARRRNIAHRKAEGIYHQGPRSREAQARRDALAQRIMLEKQLLQDEANLAGRCARRLEEGEAIAMFARLPPMEEIAQEYLKR
jgi:hypothetical protein